MLSKRIVTAGFCLFLIFTGVWACRGEEALESPYGVCAHVTRADEHPFAQREFPLMRNAGIRWVRCDFTWHVIQPKRGVFRFDHIDQTIAWARESGIRLLPILCYSTPWANPAHKHLDDWVAYVEAVVERYKDDITAWEVWNEPNLEEFWPQPDPADYTKLMKATYAAIKRIDPEALVVFGGTSHVDLDFIEGVYRNGGRDYFDVMAVHPYCFPIPPETGNVGIDLRRLRELMARHGDDAKPVWVTEIGWPTHKAPDWWSDIIRTGFTALAPERKDWRIAVLDDRSLPLPGAPSDDFLQKFAPAGSTFNRITAADITALNPQEDHALLMPPDEAFPAGEIFDAIEGYVRRGGIVVLWQGVPLYYPVTRDRDGKWRRMTDAAPEIYRTRLHIGWEAFWTREGVPQWAGLAVPEQWREAIDLHAAPRGSRFLTESALQPGDRMIPLVTAHAGGYSAPVAAAYDFNSTLKGGAVVVTLRAPVYTNSSEEQGAFLPRAMLVILDAGVERIFYYEFQAKEHSATDKEHHFGITHRDLSPKPAYAAYRTLTELRPPGSISIGKMRIDGTVHIAGWRRQDGRNVWAVWDTAPAERRVRASAGEVSAVRSYLGEDIDWQKASLLLSGAPIYLIGPDAVEVIE